MCSRAAADQPADVNCDNDDDDVAAAAGAGEVIVLLQ